MTVYLTHNGTSVRLTVDAHRSFRVVWCSNWELIGQLAVAGILRREHYGPSTYGHCEYFYV